MIGLCLIDFVNITASFIEIPTALSSQTLFAPGDQIAPTVDVIEPGQGHFMTINLPTTSDMNTKLFHPILNLSTSFTFFVELF